MPDTGAAELVCALARFVGPPERFLAMLVEAQRRLAGARCGAILRLRPPDEVDVLAVSPGLPPGAMTPPWLERAAVLSRRRASGDGSLTEPLGDGLDGRRLVVVPLPAGPDPDGHPAAQRLFGAFVLADAAHGDERLLDLSAGFVAMYEARTALAGREADVHRLSTALQAVAALNRHDRFRPVAMALCNEVAASWRCERVSLGILRGRYVRLEAMSHTERIAMRAQLVQGLEAVMEECLDQDIEVIAPTAADPGSVQPAYIARQASEFARRDGPAWVCSVPLRSAGRCLAVLTVERRGEEPMADLEIESLRLACDLCTPRLLELEKGDRWIGSLAAMSLRRAVAALLGPEHTWAKLLALGALAAMLVLWFGQGRYTAAAPFVLEAVERRAIPAPFDGYLASVGADLGDRAVAGQTVLATLETAELRLELAEALAREATTVKEAAIARSQGKLAEAQIAEASRREAQARVAILEHRIERATLVAPIDGVVVSGDQKKRVGGPVRVGEVLFEVAPVDALRAELSVPEDQIIDVRAGQSGELASISYPELRTPFVVESINPVGETVSGRTVFRVRARLETASAPRGGDVAASGPAWMRPGMEGVAKIDLGRRRLGWIWSRRLVNWVRMTLWV